MRWNCLMGTRLVQAMVDAWKRAEHDEITRQAHRHAVEMIHRQRAAKAWAARVHMNQFGLVELNSGRHYWPRGNDTWSNKGGAA